MRAFPITANLRNQPAPPSRGREMGSGVENRVRGVKRSNRYSLVTLLVFVVVVAVTTLINLPTPLGFHQTGDSKEKDRPVETRKATQQVKVEEGEKPDPYTPMIPTSYSSSGWSRSWVERLPGEIKEETFLCERSHVRSDVCHLHGIVQLVGNFSFVLNAVEKETSVSEEVLAPYTRKWEQSCMDKVGQITLRSQHSANRNASSLCDVWHKVPAVVFSTGGYTGNVYHEFNDGLIPLYITAQHLKREVVFVIVDYHDWWMIRYEEIIKRLSKYEVIDIANYTNSHCFSDVTAGLYIHNELGIDQSLMPNNESIQDFRAVLSNAYPPWKDSRWEKDFPKFGSTVSPEAAAVPQLVIINREGSRTIVNLGQVVELATRLGFDVTVLEPDPTTEMKKIFWLLDRCDVLIGVHGAALTHFLFMRPGKVFIQIVPLGTDWAAKTYYGDPAKRLGLHYIEYKITVGESSLSNDYQKNDPILVNPRAVGQRGWAVIKDIYLGKQKVELSLPRFFKILSEAMVQWKSLALPSRNVTSRGRSQTKERESIPSSQWNESEDLKPSNQRHVAYSRPQ